MTATIRLVEAAQYLIIGCDASLRKLRAAPQGTGLADREPRPVPVFFEKTWIKLLFLPVSEQAERAMPPPEVGLTRRRGDAVG